MKHKKLLNWTDKKMDELSVQLSEECMICDFVNTEEYKSAHQIWNKKWSRELQNNKNKFKKRFKRRNLNERNINMRLGQLNTLFVSYRSVLVDPESTIYEKQHAKHKLIELNRMKNLYFSHIKDNINNLNLSTKMDNDYLEILLFAFVPASFLTGYFGMNFTSMGNPGKNTNDSGLLVSKYGHYYALVMVFLSCVASYYMVSTNFFNSDAEKISNVQRFNQILTMPETHDYLNTTNNI